MSRARHEMECRARGGKAGGDHPTPGHSGEEKADQDMVYAGKGSNVDEEAEEKKRGGRAKHKRGGAAKMDGHMEGSMKSKRLDRPGRKRGGRIGADMAPLTGAARVKNASEHDSDSGNAEED